MLITGIDGLPLAVTDMTCETIEGRLYWQGGRNVDRRQRELTRRLRDDTWKCSRCGEPFGMERHINSIWCSRACYDAARYVRNKALGLGCLFGPNGKRRKASAFPTWGEMVEAHRPEFQNEIRQGRRRRF